MYALGRAWRHQGSGEKHTSLLIRAIYQILQPVVAAATPNECTHLAGRGGIKAAVRNTQAYLRQHPDSFVFKSDVKSYYASIEHVIVQQQLITLLPNEPILCQLLWQFMQRTVERGGNYRDIDTGIPLGASISPLLAALYLIPLDQAFCQRPTFFIAAIVAPKIFWYKAHRRRQYNEYGETLQHRNKKFLA